MLLPKMMIASRALLAASLIAASAAQAQTVWYVNDDGDADNGCTSWPDACPELQTALSLAGDGDQIWVSEGTYKPDYDVNTGQHTGNREATFQLISGVALYGGFNGTETKLEKRTGLFDQTILSGDLLTNDLIDAFPNGPSFEDNSHHVVTASGTNDSTVLDGFTMTAGHDTRPTPDGRGAGIYNVGGNFTLNNCIITRNYTFSPSGEQFPRGRGGGMYSENASPVLTNCVFSENRSGGAFSGWAGGLYNGAGGNMTVTDCTFRNNTAQPGPWSSRGGGMVNESGTATISSCTFAVNLGGWGGGLHNVNEGTVVVNGCTFLENTAGYGGGISESIESITTVSNSLFANNHANVSGGGMSVTNGTPTLSDCTFINNVSSGRGGGLYYSGGPGSANIFNCKFAGNSAGWGGGLFVWSSPVIINCLINSNSASEYGGGIAFRGAATVINCTITGNAAETYGGGIDALGAAPTIMNSVLWGNSASNGAEIAVRTYYTDTEPFVIPSTLTVSYCDAENGQGGAYVEDKSTLIWGAGNIEADPWFVDPDGLDDVFGTEDDNLRLLPASPCIDAADNDAVPPDETDLDDDGDTDEPTPFDLDGNPRFVDLPCVPDTGNPGAAGPPLADMGAYEVVNNDCNGNGASDACDILDGTSEDCSGNWIPDDCEPDCNGNGTADSCDIVDGTSEDCNSNGVPDECEPDEDCNQNGVQDICDIDAGESYDCDGNGVPDECEGPEISHVDDDAPGDPGPGDPSVSDPAEDGSADHPYDAIQEAIDASVCGKTVLVAAGTYNETIDFLGKAITLRSAAGPDVTIIDAGGSGTVVRCGGGEGPDTVLEGFTITGGSVSGMRNSLNSSPTVTNCTFSGNSANFGAGMYNYESSPTVTHCTFIGNTALSHGGGMANSLNSLPTVTHCTFSGNVAASLGGAMYNSRSSPTVTHCTFRGNTAGVYGGGMGNFFDCLPTVTHCTFNGNTAPWGGGMYNHVSSPTVTQCTFSANEAGTTGGGMRNVAASPTVTNCILWGNSPEEIADTLGAAATVRYSDVQGGWSGDGSNNIDADPLFVDPDGPDDDPATWQDNDYHLSAGSPCIDAADSSAVPADATDLDDDGDTDEPTPFDLDGNPRFIDDPLAPDTGAGDCPIVDMGAYEFQDGATTCCPADFDGSGEVGASDLAELLGSWGPCESCPADLDGNGQVGPFDLALLLGNWGSCPQ